MTAGALPNGLTLSGSGVLSGTPTASGPFTFTVQASDPNFNTGSKSYTLTINPTPLAISPSSLPAATLGTPYNQTVTASGGSAPYGYTVIARALPGGLSMSAGGAEDELWAGRDRSLTAHGWASHQEPAACAS